ncbi:ras guanine nucleotide exchange factor domain-containing protein [Choanephora cucurbitarum]|nr:ras guanine nucleotide exchange factor domain-containing protein [Choanephora cucurbitarum]
MIPKAPLVVVYQSLQQKLKKEASEPSEFLQEENNMKTLLSKVQNIHISATTVPTILQFQPVLIAYQLTLIDSAIFRNIPLDAILSHGPKAPHPAIVASTDFFNYLTRLIEHSILTELEACRRAQQINHWIKVAHRCDALKNYQTLKAIISALGTPPIERLKRSWAFIPKKSMSQLEALSELMSETDNYGRYREKIGLVAVSSLEDEIQTIKRRASPALSEPTVPFLGIFIHDMTYLIAANSKRNHSVCHDLLKQDIRVAELLQLFRDLQRCPPYSPHLTEACLKELHKTKKRKLSQALSRNAIKKGNFYPSFDDSQFSIEMQQCLVTQYLLTRSWVSEKTVDELSLAREPTKTTRSHSATESLAFHQGKSISCENMSSSSQPPILTTSHSLTTTVRDSSGSLTSSESSNPSRPESMEEVIEKHEHESTSEKKPIPTGSFWLFGRKSVDQKSEIGMGTMQRSPRHFSFDELNDTKKQTKLPSSTISCPSDAYRMHREGSQGSLSIFRKEFWKHQNNQQKIIDANPLPTLHPLDKMG